MLNGKAENALSVAHASSANAANAAGVADTFKNGAGTPTSWLIEYPNEAPTYLWGTHDGVTMRLWNPAYFSVNYASSAGNAGTLGGKAESTLSVRICQHSPKCVWADGHGFDHFRYKGVYATRLRDMEVFLYRSNPRGIGRYGHRRSCGRYCTDDSREQTGGYDERNGFQKCMNGVVK